MAKRGRKLKIALVAVLAILVILFVLLLIFTGGTLRLDVLRRNLTHLGQDRSENGLTGELSFVNHQGSSIRAYGNGLLIASRTGVEVLDGEGQEVLLASASMATPDVYVSGERAFACDVGGTDYVILDGKSISAMTATAEPIITASMNDAGYIAITTEQSTYKASVFVIGPDNTQLLQQNISSGYVTAAAVSHDGSALNVALLSYEDGRILTRIVRYPIGNTQQRETVIEDEMVLELHAFPSGRLCALTEKRALFLSEDLGEVKAYDFGSSYLKGFSFDAAEKCVLLLREYESGGDCRLAVLDQSGSVEGEGAIDGEVLSISAAGRYVGALYYDRLEIYDLNVALYDETTDTGSATRLIMREDGSVLLLSYGTARTYLP